MISKIIDIKKIIEKMIITNPVIQDTTPPPYHPNHFSPCPPLLFQPNHISSAPLPPLSDLQVVIKLKKSPQKIF